MSRTLRRPGRDSSPQERLRYLQALADALDALGVRPGEEYVVSAATPGGTARARRGDPDTSRAAAATTGDLRESQKAVLKLLRAVGPATDEELVAAYDAAAHRGDVEPQSASGIRSRRSELVLAGAVIDTGARRALESGRMAIVWGVLDVAAPPPPKDLLPPSLFGETEPPPDAGPRSAIFGA